MNELKAIKFKQNGQVITINVPSGNGGESFEWSVISSAFVESGMLTGVQIPTDYKVITVIYMKFPNYPSNDGTYISASIPWIFPLFVNKDGAVFRSDGSSMAQVGNPSSYVQIDYDKTAQKFVVNTEWDPSLDPGFVYILGGK